MYIFILIKISKLHLCCLCGFVKHRYRFGISFEPR